MKTLGVGIVLMVALFFCLPYHLYMKQLWKKNPEKSWEKARKFVSGFFRFELKLSGCKVNVIGKENICLLYTSPRPRDRTRYRMPSSA